MTGPALAELPGLSDAIVCDILAPILLEDVEAEMLARQALGYTLVSLTMSADNQASPGEIYPLLARMRSRLLRHPDRIVLVDTVDDIRAAKRDGKLGVNFHFQGTEPVGRELANVEAYYKLGIRWMLMAYNYQNNVGTGCIEAETSNGGLSAFGRKLIAEMNRVGMIVDCSHTGHRTTMDAMETSTQPCIFSHSNPRALHDHPRNIRDDQIKALAATGGIIGINGVGQFMGEPHETKVETVEKNLDYIVQLIGPQHVALGFDYMTPHHVQDIYDAYGGNVGVGLGMPQMPWGFLHPADLGKLLDRLLKRGYSTEDLRGIMGENFLRVASAVWK
jgi:membrane dipeptidase